MLDITALGEYFIDFTPSGVNEMGMRQFACNPGGAPVNVLAMAAKLGMRTAFVGKVGRDQFGGFLRGVLAENGIHAGGLLDTAEAPTTLAFVHLDDLGDRTFSFYRSPGADILLRPDEVPKELVTGCRVFHFGAVSLTDEPSRSATLSAARAARRSGRIVSYDPNWRPPLWKSDAEARREMLAAVPLCDILKVSEEEMELLTGCSGLEEGSAQLLAMGSQAVLVSRGARGAFVRAAFGCTALATYDVATVDTTGAGDALLGAVLARLVRDGRGPGALSGDEWRDVLDFANATGSLATAGKGAIPALPDEEAIEALRRGGKLLA